MGTHVPLLQTYDETLRREFMKIRTTSPAAAKGTQYGDYEDAIGTGQATIWFDGGTP